MKPALGYAPAVGTRTLLRATGIVLAIVLTGTGYSEGGADVTPKQARASLCLHLLASQSQPPDVVLEALEADLVLLESAGEDGLRERLEAVVESMGAGAASDVSVFLSAGVDETRRLEIEETLRDAEGIDEVRYVSEEETLAELTELYGEEFTASIDPASVPASLRLTVSGDIDTVVAAAAALDGVEDVVEGGSPAPLPEDGRALIEELCPEAPVSE